MAGPRHPTHPDYVMFDPLVEPPPQGVILLVATEGGTCVPGYWTNDCIAWTYKPRIPQTVKDRLVPAGVR